MKRSGVLLGFFLSLCFPLTAAAQEGRSIDLIDGETLYEGGWLFTIGYEWKKKSGLRDGDASVPDGLDHRRLDQSLAIAAHYGLRKDVQLSLLIPVVYKELRVRDPNGPNRLDAEGLGDISFFARYRFLRVDAPHHGANFSVFAGLEMPTGDATQKDEGVRLSPGLNPGSGSWDPIGGIAISYEPYRWKFTTQVKYKTYTEGRRDYRFGDSFQIKASIGNRVWVEKYPGPVLRLDWVVKYKWTDRDTRDGHRVSNTGGDLFTTAFNAAFHPTANWDVQVEVEVPVYQRFRGTQVETDVIVAFIVGFRY